MKPRSLMQRSAFASRRKVLLYVLTAILAATLVGAWGVSDGVPTLPVVGERIVMWQDLPDRGTPEDYDLLTNLKFAAQRLYTSSYFRTETNGTVIAKSLGISIPQTVTNIRVKKYDPVRGDIVFSESRSKSDLVDSYEQQYSEGNIIFLRQRVSGEGDDIVWSDKATHVSVAAYSERYGTIPKELSKYVIGYTSDMQNPFASTLTILSAQDENAREKAAAKTPATTVADINGNESSSVGFDVPQTLVRGADGNYTFTVELDPVNSTKYYRSEVKTRAGKSASYPNFISASITFTIDEEWTPIQAVIDECYSISVAGMPATCTSSLVEVFTQIDDPDGVVPEESFFAPLVEEVRKNSNEGGSTVDNGIPTSPIEYLAVGFADYFTGAKPLTLTVDASVSDGAFTADNLRLSIDFGSMNIRVKLGELYAEYKDDRVYVTLGDIKGYVDTDKFTALLENEEIGGLTSALGGFTELFGGDMISTIFANCEMISEGGVTHIHLPFKLGDIGVDASLYMNDATLSLKSIEGDIDAYGTSVKISAKPLSKFPTFPKSYEGYADLSGMLDFIPAAIKTAKSNTYGVTGTVTVNDTTVLLDAYVDRANGLGLDANITALGQTVNFKLIGDEAFIKLGNIKVRGGIDELPALMDAATQATGMDLSTFGDILPLLKTLIPGSASTAVSMLKSVELTGDDLSIGLNYLGIPVSLSLGKTDGALSSVAFSTAVDSFGIKLNAAAELQISTPAAREVKPEDGDYITFAELVEILNDAAPYISAEGYAVTLNGSIGVSGKEYAFGGKANIDVVNTENGKAIAATAELTVLGQTLNITYVDDAAYIAVGNIRVMLDITDIDTLVAAIEPVLSALGIELPQSSATELTDIISSVIDAVKSLTVKDGGIAMDAQVNGVSASIAASLKDGKLTASCNGDTVKLTLGGSVLPTEAIGITAPDGEYVSVTALAPTLSAVVPFIERKAISMTVAIGMGENVYDIDLALSMADGLKVKLTENSFGVTVTVIDGAAYIERDDVKLVGTLSDIPALLDAVGAVLPQEIMQTIDGLLGSLNGDIDYTAAADMLGMVKSFALSDGSILVTLATGESTTAEIAIATDLSGAVIETVVGGTDLTVTLSDIIADCESIAVPDGDFAEAREIIAFASSVLPLASNAQTKVAIGGSLLGVPVTSGSVALDGASGAFEFTVTLADFNISVKFEGGTIYVDINDGGDSPIKLSCDTSTEELKLMLSRLDYAIPGIEQTVYDIIDMFTNVTLEQMIGMFGLSSADDGFKLTIDSRDVGFDSVTDFTFTNTESGFEIAIVSAIAAGDTAIDVTAHIGGTAMDGKLTGIVVDDANILITSMGGDEAQISEIPLLNQDAPLTLSICEGAPVEVSVSGEYVSILLATEYIAPIIDLVADTEDVRTITLDLGAFLLTASDAYTEIGGTVTIALNSVTDDDGNTHVEFGGVYAVVNLFKNTDAEESLELTYVNDNIYIKTGDIMLGLNLGGERSDIVRLYDALSEYLPDYLNEELEKLLGLADGASMFSSIDLIIERLGEIASAENIADIAGLLFAPLGDLAGNSTLKTLADMVSIYGKTTNGRTEIMASATLLGITLNLTPHVNDGALNSVSLSMGTSLLGGITVGAELSFSLSPEAVGVSAPQNAADYVSVIDFVETINNAVHTFKTTDEDGNVTFEVSDFDFDYYIFAVETTEDENGNVVTVKDEAGRDKPVIDENGNKIVDKTIKVTNKTGYSLLKGKFEKIYATDENGERIKSADGKYILEDVRFALEAHVTLAISSLVNSSPISLDLYVLKTDEYPNGVAYLGYTEGNGYGENLSIDYVSVIQIVAAVMDIVGADDETVEYLLGEYRLPVDTDVFDSMAIAGFDTVRNLLDGLAKAVKHVTDALNSVERAIDLINTAGNTDVLRARMDDEVETEIVNGVEVTTVKSLGIKSLLGDAIDKVKNALAEFGVTVGDDDEEEEVPPTHEYKVINGKLFKDIVNGVSFKKTTTTLSATVDNAIATGTDGEATIAVTQTNNVLDSITVSGLDVNTAKLDNFDMEFNAGGQVTITLPDGFTSDSSDGKVTYSDLSNIKHLLFDVMNTANLMEFDIGGLDTEDAINVHLKLGADWLANLNLNIKYNVKVKIIKVGEDENGKAIYSTAAAVEIHNEKAQVSILGIGSTVIVPDCTTRLFFYDDVLYIQGIKDWQNAKQDRVVGTVTDIRYDYTNWFKQHSKQMAIKNSEYQASTDGNFEYVYSAYTVDELFWMISNDMNKFLNEFLFYLVPITTEKIAGQDIRALITDNIGGDSGNKDTSSKTIAQIFKGYTYNDGKHSIKIGLAELASSSSLSDLDIILKGENDGDDNILDNYVSYIHVNTAIAGIITVNLDATLRNVAVSDNDIYSKGLAPMNVTHERGTFSADGRNYILESTYYDRNTLYTLDGLTYLAADGGLYTNHGSFAPTLVPTDSSDNFVWTTTFNNDRYCDSGYEAGYTSGKYYYSTTLNGYGYRRIENDTYYIGTDANGGKYVYRLENGNQIRIAVKSITGGLLASVTKNADGKVIDVTNRADGIAWARPWKADFDAAQAA